MKILRKICLIVALTATGVANAYTMPDNMWVSGGATANGFTNWFNDWGVTGRQMMTKESDGTFVWMGKLTTENGGSVRLFPSPNEWGIAFAPAVDGTVITSDAAEYPVTYFDATDNNFQIQTAGYYKFTLTLTPDGAADGSLKVEYLGENAFNYDLPTNIWITGSSTTNGWAQGPTFDGGRMVMEKKGYNVYEYLGTFTAATDGFKFVCEPWAWYPAFGPATDGEEIAPADGSYNVVNLVDPADAKFAVAEGGFYILTLTLDPMNSDGGTLVVEYLGGSAVDQIDADSNAVEEMYDLNGVRVDRASAVPGIYVVKKGSKVSKVMVK
jgi:hypothetical protein